MTAVACGGGSLGLRWKGNWSLAPRCPQPITEDDPGNHGCLVYHSDVNTAHYRAAVTSRGNEVFGFLGDSWPPSFGLRKKGLFLELGPQGFEVD